MKIFLDSINLEHIKDLNSMGLISGITTNPSLLSKYTGDKDSLIKEICLINKPVSVQVVSTEYNEMIAEALKIVQLSSNIVIKLPITKNGLRVCSYLTKIGIKVNMTLCFSAAQALLASRCNATYVSPFIGRMEDNGIDYTTVLRDIIDAVVMSGNTQVICSSIRNVDHVVDCMRLDPHIFTADYKVINQMFEHNLTDQGLKKFLDDWNK